MEEKILFLLEKKWLGKRCPTGSTATLLPCWWGEKWEVRGPVPVNTPTHSTSTNSSNPSNSHGKKCGKLVKREKWESFPHNKKILTARLESLAEGREYRDQSITSPAPLLCLNFRKTISKSWSRTVSVISKEVPRSKWSLCYSTQEYYCFQYILMAFIFGFLRTWKLVFVYANSYILLLSNYFFRSRGR